MPRRGAHLAAHAGRSGGGDQGDARIVDEGLTDGTVTDDELRHRRRHPGTACGFLEQRLHGYRGDGRLLRRLPHHRVAGDEGEHGVPRPHRDREVEGRDHGDDSEWVPLLHHPVAGPLGGDGVAVELAGQSDAEVADVDHLLDLAKALADDLAGLDGHQLTECVLVFAEQFTQLTHQTAAYRRGNERPRPVGVRGCGDHRVHVARERHVAQHRTGDRAGRGQAGVVVERRGPDCGEQLGRTGGQVDGRCHGFIVSDGRDRIYSGPAVV